MNWADLAQAGPVVVLGAIVGLLLGRQIITMGEKKDSDAIKDAHMGELRTERDEWKRLAMESVDKVGQLTAALEAQNELIERQLEDRARAR